MPMKISTCGTDNKTKTSVTDHQILAAKSYYNLLTSQRYFFSI